MSTVPNRDVIIEKLREALIVAQYLTQPQVDGYRRIDAKDAYLINQAAIAALTATQVPLPQCNGQHPVCLRKA